MNTYKFVGLLSLFPLLIRAEHYQLTPLKGNPGLYFHPIGEARLIRTQWKIITTLDCKPLTQPIQWRQEQMYQAFRSCIDILGSECHTIIPIPTFKRQLINLKFLHEDLLRFFALSKPEPTKPMELPHTIRKRGAPFEFIGWASKQLFGTMDAGDKSMLIDEIANLYDTQRNISLLAENQTHIVRSNLESIHQQMAKDEEKILQIQRNLLHLVDKSQGYWTIQNKTKLTEGYKEWARKFEESLDFSLSSYRLLINAVEITAQGRLHPLLFTHHQVSALVQNILQTKHLHSLPWEKNQVTIERLFAYSKTSVTTHNAKLIVTLQFPLYGTERFTIFRLHPLPVPRTFHSTAQGYISIKPRSDYIFVTEGYQGYFFADEKYLDTCLKYENKLLCYPTEPLHEDNGKSHCEFAMLAKPSPNALKTCTITLHNDQLMYWNKLPNTNNWLYSSNDKTTLTILCNGGRKARLHLNGTGLLSLDGDCIANTDTTTIYGVSTWEITQIFEYTFDYPFNLTLFLPTAELSLNMEGLALLDQETEKQIESWANSSDSLSLKEIENKFSEIANRKMQQRHNQYYIAAGCLGNFTIIILVFLFSYIILRNRKIRVPLPRYNLETKNGAIHGGYETPRIPTIFIQDNKL